MIVEATPAISTRQSWNFLVRFPRRFHEAGCFTDSQVVAIHKQAESGTPVPELCREHGISSVTFAPALTYLRIRAICSSVKREFFMQNPLGGNSISNWI